MRGQSNALFRAGRIARRLARRRPCSPPSDPRMCSSLAMNPPNATISCPPRRRLRHAGRHDGVRPCTPDEGKVFVSRVPRRDIEIYAARDRGLGALGAAVSCLFPYEELEREAGNALQHGNRNLTSTAAAIPRADPSPASAALDHGLAGARLVDRFLRHPAALDHHLQLWFASPKRRCRRPGFACGPVAGQLLAGTERCLLSRLPDHHADRRNRHHAVRACRLSGRLCPCHSRPAALAFAFSCSS